MKIQHQNLGTPSKRREFGILEDLTDSSLKCVTEPGVWAVILSGISLTL